MTTKKQHGGSRPGAGRKSGTLWKKGGGHTPSQRKSVFLRLEPEAIKWLKSQPGTMSDNANRAIMAALEENE